jgi:hypothetical protein
MAEPSDRRPTRSRKTIVHFDDKIAQSSVSKKPKAPTKPAKPPIKPTKPTEPVNPPQKAFKIHAFYSSYFLAESIVLGEFEESCSQIKVGCEKVREGSGFDLSCPDPLG